MDAGSQEDIVLDSNFMQKRSVNNQADSKYIRT